MAKKKALKPIDYQKEPERYREETEAETFEQRQERWSNDLNEPGSLIHQIFEDLKKPSKKPQT